MKVMVEKTELFRHIGRQWRTVIEVFAAFLVLPSRSAAKEVAAFTSMDEATVKSCIKAIETSGLLVDDGISVATMFTVDTDDESILLFNEFDFIRLTFTIKKRIVAINYTIGPKPVPECPEDIKDIEEHNSLRSSNIRLSYKSNVAFEEQDIGRMVERNVASMSSHRENCCKNNIDGFTHLYYFESNLSRLYYRLDVNVQDLFLIRRKRRIATCIPKLSSRQGAKRPLPDEHICVKCYANRVAFHLDVFLNSASWRRRTPPRRIVDAVRRRTPHLERKTDNKLSTDDANIRECINHSSDTLTIQQNKSIDEKIKIPPIFKETDVGLTLFDLPRRDRKLDHHAVSKIITELKNTGIIPVLPKVRGGTFAFYYKLPRAPHVKLISNDSFRDNYFANLWKSFCDKHVSKNSNNYYVYRHIRNGIHTTIIEQFCMDADQYNIRPAEWFLNKFNYWNRNKKIEKYEMPRVAVMFSTKGMQFPKFRKGYYFNKKDLGGTTIVDVDAQRVAQRYDRFEFDLRQLVTELDRKPVLDDLKPLFEKWFPEGRVAFDRHALAVHNRNAHKEAELRGLMSDGFYIW